jgi:hypothetical protein
MDLGPILPDNEYDEEAAEILVKTQKLTDEEHIIDVINQVLGDWLRVEYVASREKLRPLARKILELGR